MRPCVQSGAVSEYSPSYTKSAIIARALLSALKKGPMKNSRFARWLLLLVLVIPASFAPALVVAQQPQLQRAEEPKTQTIYITRTGKKYHRDGCRHLAQSKIATTLKDAKAKGYTACKVWHPPE